MKLTEHFTLEELYASDYADRNNIDNMPKDAKVLNNIKWLADNLQRIRNVLKHPIHVNSAYRSLLVNAGIGSKPTSSHVKGLAADIICPGFGSPRAVVDAIISSDIEYDQVILEYDRWCHIGFSPKGEKQRLQKLIIDKSGTRKYGN
jgi:hypothetical protein